MAKSEEKELNRYRFDTDNIVWGKFSFDVLENIEHSFRSGAELLLTSGEIQQLGSILEQLKVFK